MTIELGLSPREELQELKARTHAQAVAEELSYICSETYTYNEHKVWCVSELKRSAGGEVVRRNTWYLDGRRIGENHLVDTICRL